MEHDDYDFELDDDTLLAHEILSEIRKIHKSNENKEKGNYEQPFTWDATNAQRHLCKRKKRKHLQKQAGMKEYNEIITKVLLENVDMSRSLVEPEKFAYGKRNVHNGTDWVVILTSERKVVTAFQADKPPEDYYTCFSEGRLYKPLRTYDAADVIVTMENIDNESLSETSIESENN
ncbi:hypothetical protein Q0O85_19335 [Priestia megaterium]|uniref:hypothetical protein n=1 Tax=Priestia megaterium TaxID=1404 RepID=UPI003458F134